MAHAGEFLELPIKGDAPGVPHHQHGVLKRRPYRATLKIITYNYQNAAPDGAK